MRPNITNFKASTPTEMLPNVTNYKASTQTEKHIYNPNYKKSPTRKAGGTLKIHYDS